MLSFLGAVLFVFGPSCGGKSTLSKAFIERAGASWTYLDKDQWVQEGVCAEEEAEERIEEYVASFRTGERHVLVDAQVPWRAARGEWYVLVSAPLEELLKRDARRTARLQRSAKRAYYAKLFVEETFAGVLDAPICLGFHYDLILDSSQLSLEEEVQAVVNFLRDKF